MSDWNPGGVGDSGLEPGQEDARHEPHEWNPGGVGNATADELLPEDSEQSGGSLDLSEDAEEPEAGEESID
jgi:hypothetical protein